MSVHISLVQELVARIKQRSETHGRSLIAIAGIPGAGKSTVVDQLCTQLREASVSCTAFPQDGYHYYRHQLAEFEDAPEAFRRRGAPFTFDSARFVRDIQRVRDGDTIRVPLFDHSKKDPVEDDIEIAASTRVVLVEGNYVGLAEEPWAHISVLCDELWVVEVDDGVVRDRLIKRHVDSGVCASVEEATERAMGLDWQNALYVREHTRTPDVVYRPGA